MFEDRMGRSDVLTKQGVSLADLGINNWALSAEQAASVLAACETEGLAILGGDVFVKDFDSVRFEFPNWACDKGESESWDDYVHRSCAIAAAFIEERANLFRGVELLFSFQRCSERQYSLLSD